MASSGGIAERRPSCHGLAPLVIHRPAPVVFLHNPSPSRQDIVEEGREHLQNFVFQQIRNTHDVTTPEEIISTPQGYQNPAWAKTGRELRIMADRFSRTKERELVRQQASAVNVDALTKDEFMDLLSEMFMSGGITKERIVVLFFFCSDLAILSLKSGAKAFHRLLTWCFDFMRESVCRWVEDHGGWAKVIDNSAHALAKVILCVGGVVVVFVAIKRLFITR